MVYLVYSLFDEKTRLFGNLMMFTTTDEAIRYFAFLVNEDKNKLICKDLSLFLIGNYNTTTGAFEPIAVKPSIVASALDYIGGENNG